MGGFLALTKFMEDIKPAPDSETSCLQSPPRESETLSDAGVILRSQEFQKVMGIGDSVMEDPVSVIAVNKMLSVYVEQTRQEADLYRSERDTLKAELAAERGRNEGLHKELVQRSSLLRARGERARAITVSPDLVTVDVKKRSEEIEQINERLKFELENLRTDSRVAEGSLSSLRNKIKCLRAEKGSLQSALQCAREEVTKHKTSAVQFEVHQKNYLQTIATLEDHERQLIKELSDAREALHTAVQLKSNSGSQSIPTVEATIVTPTIIANQSGLLAEIDSLKGEVNRLKAREVQSEAELTKSESRLRCVENEVVSLMGKKSQLETDLKFSERLLARKEEELKSRIGSLEAANSLSLQMAEVIGEERVKEIEDRLKKSSLHFQSEIEGLEGSIAELKKENHEKSDKLKEFESIIENLKSSITSLTTDLSSSKKSEDFLKNEISIKQKEIDNLVVELGTKLISGIPPITPLSRPDTLAVAQPLALAIPPAPPMAAISFKHVQTMHRVVETEFTQTSQSLVFTTSTQTTLGGGPPPKTNGNSRVTITSCSICKSSNGSVWFAPCGHVACAECSGRLKAMDKGLVGIQCESCENKLPVTLILPIPPSISRNVADE